MNVVDPNGEQSENIMDQRNAALASFAKDNPKVALTAGLIIAGGVELAAAPALLTTGATATTEGVTSQAAGGGLRQSLLRTTSLTKPGGEAAAQAARQAAQSSVKLTGVPESVSLAETSATVGTAEGAAAEFGALEAGMGAASGEPQAMTLGQKALETVRAVLDVLGGGS